MNKTPKTAHMLNPWPMRFPSVWDELMDTNGVESTGSGLSVSVDEASVYVEAALPGISPNDIDVRLQEGTVTITAATPPLIKGRKYYRKTASIFNYNVVLPTGVEESEVPKAESKDGVLSLTFRKLAKAKAKKIAVTSSSQAN